MNDQELTMSQIQALSPETQMAHMREAAAAWLALDAAQAAAAWQGELGARMRQLADLELWRQGLMHRDQDLRERAEALLDSPATAWQARLALLLYKRWDRTADIELAPEWFAAYWQEQQPRLGQCLELLAPVQDFTVTITIPTFNRVQLLKRAVSSILAQSYPHWRLIICDDGSSDGTEAYGRQLESSDERIRYLRKPQNSGLLDTYLQLLKAVETELIVCFADDDVLYSHLLERAVGFFRAHPRLACVGGGFHTKVQVGPFYAQDCVADNRLELIRCCFVSPLCPLGTVQRKAVLAEVAAYDPWTQSVQGEYAISDYLSSVKILGRFEVGLLNEIMGFHDISDISSQYHRDDTPLYTGLIRELVGDFERLYGKGSFPGDALLYFLNQRTFLTYLFNNFSKTLAAETDSERWQAFAASKQPGWEAFFQTRIELLAASDPQAGPLNEGSALGPGFGAHSPGPLVWYQQAQQFPKES